MSQVKKTSMSSLTDNALSLTSRQPMHGGRSRVKVARRTRPPQRARLEVEGLEDRLVPAALVLSNDGTLWLENPGWQTAGRTWIDGNVRSFTQGSDGYYYVLG